MPIVESLVAFLKVSFLTMRLMQKAKTGIVAESREVFEAFVRDGPPIKSSWFKVTQKNETVSGSHPFL